ncbi:hypothetical protein SAMN05216412_10584 [Nitrosospira multiformis]|uniref:Uncharacterized protein n=1 Tax=Nitrosospira multiformis TaxID=1231 RepID=A0A1I0DQC5_9PROT|nr:hypothetical protein [Nitrosospira multiformis]SET34122.1 hypothetical protein SAMN05216412_10584 [Nitrosospira multiformis]
MIAAKCRGQLRFATVIAVLIFLSILGNGAFAQGETQQGVIELTLPRPVSGNEKVWVEVRTRALPKQAEIRVTAPDETLFGTISPYGAPGTLHHEAATATYTIPLPPSAISDGHVELCLEVDEPDKPPRAPWPVEVESLNLVYVPVSD